MVIEQKSYRTRNDFLTRFYLGASGL